MNWDSWLPPLVVLSSFFPGIFIFLLRGEYYLTRTWLNLLGAFVKLALVGVMLWGVAQPEPPNFEFRFPLAPEGLTEAKLELMLHSDALSLLFVTLSAVLWLLTTIYAIGYLRGSPHQSRFFGFFSICVSATTGIALAGNLITFLIFYELLTLATYPLVVHHGSKAALAAGRIYLTYTLAAGAVLFLAIVWLHNLTADPLEFRELGLLRDLPAEHHGALVIIFFLFIAGLGVKAALVPLHGWLPNAMVAPAPVTALLHAVAVVKAGAFGIVRVVYDVFGIEFSVQLGVTTPLAILASITIVYGSVRALSQDHLKRRLAYSTVSQVSYIALGVAVAGPLATVGGLVHIVHQGVMKITLFFCAGILAETLGITTVSQMNGVGRRMPWTMAAFTVGALGMIGVPPMAGFMSKWFLATGAMQAHQPWVIGVLVASTLLNAGYFLPVIYRAWFLPQQGPWPEDHDHGRLEADWMLLLPTVTTATLTLLTGLFANTFFTPLTWAKMITAREYAQQVQEQHDRRVRQEDETREQDAP